jgi:hypothetical protein
MRFWSSRQNAPLFFKLSDPDGPTYPGETTRYVLTG